MIAILAHIRRLLRHERGAAVTEFALILPVFAVLLLGTFDLGYQVYLRSLVNGTVQKAARQAAVGSVSTANIDTYIKNQLKGILPASQRNSTTVVTITKKSYANFSNVNKAEKITSDTAPLGTYNSTDCYADANSNGVYDASGGKSGLGGADDIVYYEVVVSMPRLFPLHKFINVTATQTTTAIAMIRNQPYAAQATVLTRCS